MLIGKPNKLCFIIERIPEWENESFVNGIMFVCVEDGIYPKEVRTTTLNSELYSLADKKGAFMNPAIEPDTFVLAKEELFNHIMKVTYPGDYNKDNDYRYVWSFHEINDAGYRFFSVSDGQMIKILVCRVDQSEEMLNMIEMELEEYKMITQEIQSLMESLS